MNCREFRGYLDNLIAQGMNPSLKLDLTAHAADCADCRRDYEGAMHTLALLQPSGRTEVSTELKERIMKTLTVLENAEARRPQDVPLVKRIWRPSLALGAVVVFAALAVALVLFRPAAPVYALEETIEANEQLRSIHLETTLATQGCVTEVWAQFDENGEVEILRMNFSDTEDGPKDVVWENGKATVWFRAKGSVVTVKEENLIERLKAEFGTWDPRRLVKDVHTDQSKGKSDIRMTISNGPTITTVVADTASGPEERSADAIEPIVLTVSATSEPEREDVFVIDPATKLVKQHDRYQLCDGKLDLVWSTEYLEYNEPLDPSVFALDAPQDAVRIDETTQEVGLVQGNLSDNEIAKKVVREFFEALIAKDYAKAGRMYEGLPADKAKEAFGHLQVVRIVEIGEPTPHLPSQSLRVPCKVEVGADGETHIWEPYGPVVRQLYQQPERWALHGGI